MGLEGDGVGEAPRETGYISYVFALLFTEFTNDNSGYAIYR